ncbi:hypothetical protein [Streptomyces boninensis]|uniref:hypothetical protein n=1 Tax=Streptomyces boninensis TaxID=2039455 RepID=UPI003B21AEEB
MRSSATSETGGLAVPVVRVLGDGGQRELCALARVLFYSVLDVHPYETSIGELAVLLATSAPAAAPPVGAESVTEADPGAETAEAGVPTARRPLEGDSPLGWLDRNRARWQPQDLIHELERVRDLDQVDSDWHPSSPDLSMIAQQLLNLHRRLTAVLDGQDTMLATAVAADLFTRQVHVGSRAFPGGRRLMDYAIKRIGSDADAAQQTAVDERRWHAATGPADADDDGVAEAGLHLPMCERFAPLREDQR